MTFRSLLRSVGGGLRRRMKGEPPGRNSEESKKTVEGHHEICLAYEPDWCGLWWDSVWGKEYRAGRLTNMQDLAMARLTETVLSVRLGHE